MATLTDDEMARVKAECLDNVLDYQANPYVSVLAVYNLIKEYVLSSSVASTTSTTSVTSTGATVLTLASATGYAAAQRVVIDVDDARETCTIRNVSGSTVSVVCRKLHSGTYPVEVESPLTIVRGILSDLVSCEQAERNLLDGVGIKRADEVEWFGASGESDPMTRVMQRRNTLRMRLAEACGIGWVVRAAMARRASGSFEVY